MPPLAAESDAAESAATLPPIIVTAGRVAQSAAETLASVTVITRGDIERDQALSVPDLLRGVPGVSLRRNIPPRRRRQNVVWSGLSVPRPREVSSWNS